MFGASHVLDRLVKIAPDTRTRQRTAVLAEKVKRQEEDLLAQGSRFMSSDVEKPDDFANLPTFYRRKPGAEADILISQLFKSLDIYRDWALAAQHGQLTRYRQGFEREQNMKRLFMLNFNAAERLGEKVPKVLFKFGHNHSYRGINRSGISTIGNFVSELAVSAGHRSFHLAVYANNDQKGYYDILEKDADYGALMRAGSPREWVVVDFRPLRPLAYAGRISNLTPEQRSLIFGFDAALLIGSQKPGSNQLTQTTRP